MTVNGWLQIAVFLALILVVTKPLGVFMTRVFNREKTFMDPVLRPLERLLYRVTGVDEDREMGWKEYAVSVLLFSAVSMLLLYLLQRVQGVLPFNPQKLGKVTTDLAFNTAASFTTNTNWQAYMPETTMSYLTQMAGLAYHNFVSAATGIALAIAFIRGIARREKDTLGNFWVDLVRGCLWVLLPLCIVGALVLVWQGVPQNLKSYDTVKLIEPQQVPKVDANGKPVLGPDGKQVMDTVTEQTIAQGPVASQEIIKELGTNGGGFFNANSSHPYENPTPLTNLIEMLAIFAIGAGLTYTLGRMTGSQRHGWAVWAAMAILFLAGVTVAYWAESRGNPLLAGANQRVSATQPGGNMEGKEVRFGIANSALWATVTTDTSCGAVNSMHDSYTPLGRHDSAGQHDAGRGGFRRSRFRNVRHAGLCHPGGVHRGTDGRSYPGVSGQESGSLRREDGHAGGADLSPDNPGFRQRLGAVPVWHLKHCQPGAARILRDFVCVHRGCGQQRFGVRRAQWQHALV